LTPSIGGTVRALRQHQNDSVPLGVACALLLALTNPTLAKIATTSLPGTVSIEGWQFKANSDGQLGLARADSRRWTISAPTMTDPQGLFVSANPDGETPTVHLVPEQSPDTKWAFEFLNDFGPNPTTGTTGYRFRMKVAEGPFQDWYIGVDPLPAASATPAWRPLKLVQDRRLAAGIEYITAFHRGEHSMRHRRGGTNMRASSSRYMWTLGLPIALVCALLLGLTRVAMAGYQAKKQVAQLSLDGWQLKAEDGQLGLAQTDAGKWYASAPVVTDEKGLYVSSDPDGKQPTVYLVKDKGAHVNWAFEFVEQWKPKPAGREEGLSNANKIVGKKGFRFKMKVAEGPFKDWYVAVDPLSAEAKADPKQAPKWRPLKLVQDAKSAAEFVYVDIEYSVGHK
jgi:hypothetical protein